MTFLFSFLHELAHAGAAKLFGCGFSIGTAGIFGNVVYVRSEGSTVFIKTFIQIAGPALNLVIAGVTLGLVHWRILPESDLTEMVIYSNGMLAAFNLLPFFPIPDRVSRRRQGGENRGHFFFKGIRSFYFLFGSILGKI